MGGEGWEKQRCNQRAAPPRTTPRGDTARRNGKPRAGRGEGLWGAGGRRRDEEGRGGGAVRWERSRFWAIPEETWEVWGEGEGEGSERSGAGKGAMRVGEWALPDGCRRGIAA